MRTLALMICLLALGGCGGAPIAQNQHVELTATTFTLKVVGPIPPNEI